jgi:cytochrome oxidase Cu insertion factor (SCO1/SenC/PrrC family)
MRFQTFSRTFFVVMISLLLISACSATAPQAQATTTPDWFNIDFTDSRTGKTFTMNDFAGKVVLVETMAMWCPNCIFQAAEVRKMHELLGNPDDLVSVSLDIDLHEDAAALKEYADRYGFEWRFAIAPIEAARALGNLYSAQYLNPPIAPMLIIDRNGNVHHLEYGRKDAEMLQKTIAPYLAQ